MHCCHLATFIRWPEVTCRLPRCVMTWKTARTFPSWQACSKPAVAVSYLLRFATVKVGPDFPMSVDFDKGNFWQHHVNDMKILLLNWVVCIIPLFSLLPALAGSVQAFRTERISAEGPWSRLWTTLILTPLSVSRSTRRGFLCFYIWTI